MSVQVILANLAVTVSEQQGEILSLRQRIAALEAEIAAPPPD